MTDQDIIQILGENQLQKNRTILKQIYAESYTACERMIVANSGSVDDAKDIFQDAIVIFYNKAKEPEFSLASKISTYLYAVCKNLWLKQLRSKKPLIKMNSEELEYIEGGVLVPDKESLSNNAIVLQELLEKSGEKCLTLLKMFYYEKLKMKEISSTLGFSSAQVAKNQKVRCLKKIRSIMNETPGYLDALGA